jgi:predicted membrane chloride channel (bestrophin family)
MFRSSFLASSRWLSVQRLVFWEMSYHCILQSCFLYSGTHNTHNGNQLFLTDITRRFIVGLAISFRMQASYNRWWDGRIQWDRLSTLSRSFARTVWIHIPEPFEIDAEEELSQGKRLAIQCPHMLAVALKHHLRDERDWDSCTQLKDLLSYLPDVSDYFYSSCICTLAKYSLVSMTYGPRILPKED